MECMEWEAQYSAREGLIRHLESQALPDSYVLLLTGSFGDIFPNLALLKSFHESTGKRITVVISNRWSLLASRFSFEFVKYVLFEGRAAGLIHQALLNSGRAFMRMPGYLYPLLPTLHPLVCDFILSGRVTDYECKRQILGLEPKAPFFVPALSDERLSSIRTYLLGRNVKLEKTVVVSFITQTNPPPNEAVQNLIVDMLKSENIGVVYNVSESNQNSSAEGSRHSADLTKIEIPCDAPVETIKMIGGYVGAAHGLTAILATFGDNKVIAQTIFGNPDRIPNNGRLICPTITRSNIALGGDVKNRLVEIVSDSVPSAAMPGITEFLRICRNELL